MDTRVMTMQEVEGGITAAKGFRSCGFHCGVKKAKKDLAVLVSDTPAATAAVFTLNSVPAAPVIVDRILMERTPFKRALVVNSGNANACTGERGMRDAWAMVHTTADVLGLDAEEVLISSTGVIGQFLPIERIEAGIRAAGAELSADGNTDAAEAIRTTDTFPKQFAVSYETGGRTVTVGGMAKGSGMIAPNMATMLAFITTDAAVEPAFLQAALLRANDRSFHRISVDGDTSTNDMVAVFANGAAGAPALSARTDPGCEEFEEALEKVCVELARMIVRDGEGATKFIEITVTGAVSEEEAARGARAIANSNLVKTAIHGEDANWGRILAALGNAAITFDPARVEIRLGELPILRRNFLIDFSEEEAAAVLALKDIAITADLGAGTGEATFWTCDLSSRYIEINANYRT